MNTFPGDTISLNAVIYKQPENTIDDLTGKVVACILLSGTVQIGYVDSTGTSTPAGADLTITNPVQGMVTVNTSPASTTGMKSGNQVTLLLKVTDGSGHVFTAFRDTIMVQ